MRQLFEAHLAQPDQLTVEHRVGAKEDVPRTKISIYANMATGS